MDIPWIKSQIIEQQLKHPERICGLYFIKNNLNFQIVAEFDNDFIFPGKEGILSGRILGKETLYLIKNVFPGFPDLEKEVQAAPAKHNPLK